MTAPITWEFPSSAVSGGGARSVPAGETDHVAEALDRLPQQFKTDPSTVALLESLVRPCQSLETALQDMLVDRAVDTAVGAQLDIIGKLVGQARSGQSDAEFRRFIRARIKTNRSRGVVSDLITIARLILNEPAAHVHVESQAVAGVVIRVDDLAVDEEMADDLITFLRVAVSAGVRIILESSPADSDGTFTLDDGPGFDSGYAGIVLGEHAPNMEGLVVRSKVAGAAGNAQTITFVGDGTVPGPVVEDASDCIVHFEPGTTTVAAMWLALNQEHDWIALDETTDPALNFSATVLDAGDAFGPVNLAGGGDAGGEFSDARE